MATEIELKLRVAPGHIPALIAQLDQLAQRQHTRTLRNHYYDTSEAALSAAGCALRIRQSGEQWEQTLKTRGTSTAGLQQRGEWNWPLSQPQLDASLFNQEDVRQHWPASVDASQLDALFATHFERHCWHWEQQQTRIEIVIDQGSVQARGQELPLCELELELQSGDIASLWQLTEQLCQHTPLWLSDISKAERGYALAIPGTHWAPDWRTADTLPLMPRLNRLLTCLKRALESWVWDQDFATPVSADLPSLMLALQQLYQALDHEGLDTQASIQALDSLQQTLALDLHARPELQTCMAGQLLRLAHQGWQLHQQATAQHSSLEN